MPHIILLYQSKEKVMSSQKPITVLAVSSYEKGFDFMRECKDQGCRVLLLTSKSLETAPWPKEAIDETFYMADKNNHVIRKIMVQ